MKKCPQSISYLCAYLTVVCTLPTSLLFGQSVNSKEEAAIRALITHFYDGWNAHDAEKMVSVYSDSREHVNAFAEWRTGRQTLKEELTRFHAGPGKKSQKTIRIEKVKFIKPDIALAIVRQTSTVGNVGMFVLSKMSGKWLVEGFSNVEYKLQGTESKGDGEKKN